MGCASKCSGFSTRQRVRYPHIFSCRCHVSTILPPRWPGVHCKYLNYSLRKHLRDTTPSTCNIRKKSTLLFSPNIIAFSTLESPQCLTQNFTTRHLMHHVAPYAARHQIFITIEFPPFPVLIKWWLRRLTSCYCSPHLKFQGPHVHVQSGTEFSWLLARSMFCNSKSGRDTCGLASCNNVLACYSIDETLRRFHAILTFLSYKEVFMIRLFLVH